MNIETKQNFSPTMPATTQTKTLAIPLITFKTKSLVETILFLVVLVAVPAILAHTPGNQWITGILVNALLFGACFRVGIVNAILLSIIPSSIALLRGLLPIPMAIIIPYVILGNSIMIIAFGLLPFKSLLPRIIIAASLKFFLIFSATLLLTIIPREIIQMMQWPQLITALAGGLLA
ncbi:MAG: hypothetical protein U9Q72_01660, partial [Patescibacteria group bacterium]|nr:hypothetical protein [Patescibacteria group bacterium]